MNLSFEPSGLCIEPKSKSEKVSDSHRNGVSLLAQGLRSACNVIMLSRIMPEATDLVVYF